MPELRLLKFPKQIGRETVNVRIENDEIILKSEKEIYIKDALWLLEVAKFRLLVESQGIPASMINYWK